MLYTGDRFPAWQGSLFVGGLAGEQMARLTLDGEVVVSEETLLQGPLSSMPRVLTTTSVLHDCCHHRHACRRPLFARRLMVTPVCA